MSIGIYKYQNKINNKIYIGQSDNIEKRFNQHISDAKNRPQLSSLDSAIHKYGIENFTFEIIEQCSIDKLDEREIFWIRYYNSYNNGYNRTPGGKSLRGENHPKAILTEQDVWFIRECYKNHISKRDTFKAIQHTGISERGFKKVWYGENWQNIHMDVYTIENKLWHKQNVGHSEDQLNLSSLDRAIKQDEINLWLQEKEKGLTINAIAKKYHRDNGTIEKYLNNPIAKTKVKYKGRKIKNLNTGQIFQSISAAARWAQCGATTLTRHLATDKIAGKVPETNEPAKWEELI